MLLARKSGELCGGWSELLRGRRKWGNGEAAEGKKKIKNRGGGRRLLLFGVRDRFSFRFRVCFLYFSDVSKLPPPLFEL